MTVNRNAAGGVRREGSRTWVGDPQYRDYAIPSDAIDVEARTVELAFSSEAPVARWWGTEVLSHQSGAIRMDRLQNGAALLVDHDTRDQVGVVVRTWIGPDRVARAIVRFSRSVRGEEIFQDVIDGIRKLVSVGYRIHEMVLSSRTDDSETYTVTDWEPFEVSLVAVPADATVGVGRSANHSRPLSHAGPAGQQPQERSMPDDVVPNPAPAATPPPADPAPADTAALTRSAVAAERERRNALAALGKQHNRADMAESAIADGTSVEAFRSKLLESLRPSATVRPAEDPHIGMSGRELERFSFCRALLVAADPLNPAYREAAAFELECSRAARDKQLIRAKEREAGITLPVDVLNARIGSNAGAIEAAARMLFANAQGGAAYRDLVVGTATAGGNLVATNLLGGSFIDLLRNKTRVIELGATLLRDLSGNVAIPRQTGGASTYWVAESGAPTESQQAVDQVTLTPKTIGAFTDYSRRLLLQSSIDVEAFVRADLALMIAIGIDSAALNGTGSSNQPTGLFNTSGVGAVVGGTNGAAPTWDHVTLLEEAVATANAEVGALAYLSNAKVRGKLKRTQKFSGTNGQEIWLRGRDPKNGVGELNGYDAYVTNQVPSNLDKGTATGVCSAIAYGNWADLMIGLWGGLDLMLDPYTGATSGTKRVVALQDCDVNLRRPASFAVMKDALTS